MPRPSSRKGALRGGEGEEAKGKRKQKGASEERGGKGRGGADAGTPRRRAPRLPFALSTEPYPLLDDDAVFEALGGRPASPTPAFSAPPIDSDRSPEEFQDSYQYFLDRGAEVRAPDQRGREAAAARSAALARTVRERAAQERLPLANRAALPTLADAAVGGAPAEEADGVPVLPLLVCPRPPEDGGAGREAKPADVGGVLRVLLGSGVGRNVTVLRDVVELAAGDEEKAAAAGGGGGGNVGEEEEEEEEEEDDDFMHAAAAAAASKGGGGAAACPRPRTHDEARAVMRKAVALELLHAGFDRFESTAMDVIGDAACSFVDRYTKRVHQALAGAHAAGEHADIAVANESVMRALLGRGADLREFYSHSVVENGEALAGLRRKLLERAGKMDTA